MLALPLMAAVWLSSEDGTELCKGLAFGRGPAAVLAGGIDFALGEHLLHHGHDVLLFVRQVHRESGVDAGERCGDGRGVRRTTTFPPRWQGRVERHEVDQHVSVLLLQARHVQHARGCPLVEGVPQVFVLELVVRMQADRQHAEVVANHVGLGGVTFSDAGDERRTFAEARAIHTMDLDHAARVAGSRAGPPGQRAYPRWSTRRHP